MPAAAEKVILCGASETPPHTRIKKASINTTEWVKWEHAETAVSAISNLKSQISNLNEVEEYIKNEGLKKALKTMYDPMIETGEIDK